MHCHPQLPAPVHSEGSERLVAQTVKHVTFNHGIEGSSLSELTMKSIT
jgi:hypothetical protein